MQGLSGAVLIETVLAYVAKDRRGEFGDRFACA